MGTVFFQDLLATRVNNWFNKARTMIINLQATIRKHLIFDENLIGKIYCLNTMSRTEIKKVGGIGHAALFPHQNAILDII